jgi:hypothetical protein
MPYTLRTMGNRGLGMRGAVLIRSSPNAWV